MDREREDTASAARAPGRLPLGLWPARLVAALLLGILLFLGYLVLEDFLVPLLWAAILAYVTWPINCRIRAALRGHSGSAALLMTLLLSVVIILPLIALLVSLRQEITGAFEWLRAILAGGSRMLPEWLPGLPWVGRRIADAADRIAANPELLGDWLAERATTLAGEAAGVAGVVGRNAAKLLLALVAVFFIYRDGEQLMLELRRGLSRLLGGQSEIYWSAGADMTRAVVYGLVLTAIAQGALAGMGYAVAGTGAPALLGVVTALFALIPFGAPVVWGGVALYLLWHGEIWSGVGVAIWGALAVSSVDNLVRPLVISATARIPFLLVLFGVLGGLSAFGLVGLFLGPVVLAVLLTVWRHWLEYGSPTEGEIAPD